MPKTAAIFKLPRAALLALACLASTFALAEEGPPMEGGIITNSTLHQNQDVINAQGVGAITSFMAGGAQTCDASGKNCHSLFGADDSIDYGSVTQMGNTALGTAAQSFSDENNGVSISVQTGALTIACGNTKAQTVAGVAVRASACAVNDTGDARVTVQVCTAPMRGIPVESPENAVSCSTNPSDPSYFPPAGKVCARQSCDSEPQGSLNGWSAPKQLFFDATLEQSASADAKAKNGLALVFYPDLAAGVTPSFAADSDNMTAVKVVQSFVDSASHQTAVGLRVAYRQKTKLTKDQMTDGASSVVNPGQYTSSWDSVQKIAVNPLIPQYQSEVAKNATAGLTKLQAGIKKGQVEVFDPNYVGKESGVKPGATTANIAAAGEGCGTTSQCLKWVTNTNTWTATCQADVPLSMRSCTTVTDYTKEDIHSVRTRSTEICHEARTTARHECVSSSDIASCRMVNYIDQGGITMTPTSGDTRIQLVGVSADGLTYDYLIGTIGDNYWGTGYYSRSFSFNIQDVANVKSFRMYSVGYDDEMAVAVNGTWVWADFAGMTYNPTYDQWGQLSSYTYCSGDYTWVPDYPGSDNGHWVEDCQTVTNWINKTERSTNWRYNVNVDMRGYLHNGANTVRIDTGTVDLGEGWIYVEVSAYAPVCDFNYRNLCQPYEDAR